MPHEIQDVSAGEVPSSDNILVISLLVVKCSAAVQTCSNENRTAKSPGLCDTSAHQEAGMNVGSVALLVNSMSAASFG